MISYSVKAIRGLAHFFKPFNDLDVYVEDTTSRNFYEILINRILDGKAKVYRIFQLGGREVVIRACSEDQNNHHRPRLYIIDGDYDLLLGINPPRLKRLYRLNVYCSENLIMCEEAVHQIGYESMSNTPLNNIKALIDYDAFIGSIESDLLELFYVYPVAFRADNSIQTVGFHVDRLCSRIQGYSQLDHKKLEIKKSEILSMISTFYTVDGAKRKIEEIKKRYIDNGYKGIQVISGKTYLLPLLYFHLIRTVNYRGRIGTLLTQMARFARIDVDKDLANAIILTSKGMLYYQTY